MTYKCLEKRVNLGLTEQVDGRVEVGVQVQVEREGREAETNVTNKASEIQSGDIAEK
jgi:hypothetical protein